MSDNGKGSGRLHARTQIPPDSMRRRWEATFARCEFCGEPQPDISQEEDGVVRYAHAKCLGENWKGD